MMKACSRMYIMLEIIGGCLMLLVQHGLGEELDFHTSTTTDAYPMPQYAFACNNTTGFCSRRLTTPDALNASSSSDDTLQDPDYAYHANALHLCAMVCGKYRTLWPHPSGNTQLGNRFVVFELEKMSFEYHSDLPPRTARFLDDIADIFVHTVRTARTECAACIIVHNVGSGRVTVRFSLLQPATTTLDWSTDESYTLDVQTTTAANSTIMAGNLMVGAAVHVQLKATTVFGLRHGLVTLAQLMAHSVHDRYSTTVILNSVKISDSPAFAHRGLLLDTASNPLRVADLERTIRAMAATKLNTLHWHATSTQSFALDVPSVPEMAAYAANSATTTHFTATAVRALIAYALRRGVRVLLEIDAPSDAGNGWQWGPQRGLGQLSLCFEWQPWRSYCERPPCGFLNPANKNVLAVLRRIYADVKRMLPVGERVLHMGGDEVHFGCWNASEDVLQYIAERGMNRQAADFRQLWAEFLDDAHSAWTDVVQQADGEVGNNDGAKNTSTASTTLPKVILWSSHLTDPDTIEKRTPSDRYVIQTSVPAADKMPGQMLALGYQMIMSTKNAWWFDRGLSGDRTAYSTWSKAYNNRIPHVRGVLGGEACVWSELIDGQTLDGRVWPRAAAVAERLWSNPKQSAAKAMVRMYRMRERLVRIGVAAEAVAPEWCVQNEGECL